MFLFLIYLNNKKFTFKFGVLLSKLNFPGFILLFIGNMGLGKTFLARGFINNQYRICVKSPTYTLVEEYQAFRGLVYHFDFYRLKFYYELDEIDFTSYLNSDSLLIIEWGNKFSLLRLKSHIFVYFFYYLNYFNRLILLKSYFFNFKKLFGY